MGGFLFFMVTSDIFQVSAEFPVSNEMSFDRTKENNTYRKDNQKHNYICDIIGVM